MKVLHGENAVINQVVNYHGKEDNMKNTNANANNAANIERRAIKRAAMCPVCTRLFTGDAVIVPAVRGKFAYIHAGCEKNALTGKAFQPFNSNGGSTNYFDVKVHTTAKNKDDRITWAVYMRSAGFDVRTGVNNIVATADVPAQSISKTLRTLFKACKSVEINGENFKKLEKALEYVKNTTHGNSH